MAWDFLRTFSGHGLLRTRAQDCGFGMEFVEHVRAVRPARHAQPSPSPTPTATSSDTPAPPLLVNSTATPSTASVKTEGAESSEEASLPLVVRSMATDDLLAAIRSSNWRAHRFMSQIHVALMRLILGEKRACAVCHVVLSLSS